MGCSCTKSRSGERNKFIDNIMFFFRRAKNGPKTTALGPGFIQVELPEEEQDLEILFVHSERNKVLSKLPTIEEETTEELFLETYADHLAKQLLRNENFYTMTWRNKLETILEETDEELLSEMYGKRTVQQRTLYRSKFTSLGFC